MNAIRWIARILSALAALYWLLAGILTAIFANEPWIPESNVVAVMIVCGVLLTLLAWWKEGIGGVALILFGLAFSTFAYISSGHSAWFAVLVTGVPFIIAGMLFLVRWQKDGVKY